MSCGVHCQLLLSDMPVGGFLIQTQNYPVTDTPFVMEIINLYGGHWQTALKVRISKCVSGGKKKGQTPEDLSSPVLRGSMALKYVRPSRKPQNSFLLRSLSVNSALKMAGECRPPQHAKRPSCVGLQHDSWWCVRLLLVNIHTGNAPRSKPLQHQLSLLSQ